MLGNAETPKIRADVDAERTGGMFWRITQHGELHTVDALVAQLILCDVRTETSGHYFYEHFVSEIEKRFVHRPSETHDSSVILFSV